ncbi:hypothetical protein EI555_013847, partial [Monodon monoceros]
LFSLEHLGEPGRYQAPVTQEPQAGSALSITGESSRKAQSRGVLVKHTDALQDFGLSVDQCLKQLKPNINIRFGIILREDIKELFLDIALFSKGLSILNFSYPICEVDLPKFSFCGRRKGEGGGQELTVEARTPRPASGSPSSPVDELNLTYHHVLYKNDHTAHPTGPALRGTSSKAKAHGIRRANDALLTFPLR